MGPITLFDKSFLQSLSIDESVWFDHFFLTNVAPMFYVETLADLSKVVRGRSPEHEVRIIAAKFPDMHGMPCSHHTDLCISNLLGNRVPMTGQIPLSRGRLVKQGGKPAEVFEETNESKAFSRWQKNEFQEIERHYASSWRKALQNLKLKEVAEDFRILGIETEACKSFLDASDVAKAAVHSSDKRSELMEFAFKLLNIPIYLHSEIRKRWNHAGQVPLFEYAPYAAFVLTVEVFFYISLAAKLISNKHPSNQVDIAYLFYLPFCMMFVSNDHLHKNCSHLFLRDTQEFVWGQDLKKSLCKINEHFRQLPESEREKGVIAFSSDLPGIEDSLMKDLWKRLLPKTDKTKKDNSPNNTIDTKSITWQEIKRIEDAPALTPEEIDFDPLNVDQVLFRRHTRRTRGSWKQISDSIK